MTAERAVFALIAGSVEVTALVGSRVYQMTTPPNPQSPFLVFQRVGTRREHVLTGHTDFSAVDMQVDILVALTVPEAADLARDVASKVMRVLDGFQGTVAGVKVWSIHQTYDVIGVETDVQLVRVTQRYRVIHRDE